MAGPKQLVGNLVGPRGHIGARRHCDRVLAVSRNHDRSAARRRLDDPHQLRIDTVAAQHIQRKAGKWILADGSGEHDRGTGTAGGQRLIGALAAGEQGVVSAEHRLARPR